MNNTNTVTLDLKEYNEIKEFNNIVRKNGMVVSSYSGYPSMIYYTENQAIRKIQIELKKSEDIERETKKLLVEALKLNDDAYKYQDFFLVKLFAVSFSGIILGVSIVYYITKYLLN